MIRHLLALAAAGPLFLFAPRAAAADDVIDDVIHYSILRFRGFGGGALRYGDGIPLGGDFHVGWGGSKYVLLFGGRFGAAGSTPFSRPFTAPPASTQFSLFDMVFQGYFKQMGSVGLYVGGGIVVGRSSVDTFGFSYSTLYGAYGEIGAETHRHGPVRLVGSLRLELIGTDDEEFSRIRSAGAFGMATLNVGILFGGKKTRAEEPPSRSHEDPGAPHVDP